MSIYRVETEEVDVEVHFAPDAKICGKIFLRPGVASHSGAETVRDRLTEPSPFLPLRIEGSRAETVFVSKSQILYLSVRSPKDEAAQFERSAAARVSVEVELETGEKLGGEIFVLRPPGQARILDVLNSRDDAYLRIVDAEYDFLINPAHVRLVRER